ncbi:hypothetical protein [Nonomuraea sediminis]|uniref:hypothetical protein n=1 Tax=Nonomuraea sediminis TaxID=2835864 RepID=UPI001BDBCE13|nr:hypothetical protein [Nonomuraea sediminis]
MFLPVWMGGWIIDAVRLAAIVNPAYEAVRDRLLTGSASTVFTLVVIVVLSVVKPWGRLTPRRA